MSEGRASTARRHPGGRSTRSPGPQPHVSTGRIAAAGLRSRAGDAARSEELFTRERAREEEAHPDGHSLDGLEATEEAGGLRVVLDDRATDEEEAVEVLGIPARREEPGGECKLPSRDPAVR